MATYTCAHCGKDYVTAIRGWHAEGICEQCFDKGLPWPGGKGKTGPEPDFIIEQVEDEPSKVPFKCSNCGATGTIQRSRLPKDKSRVRVKCPKCSTVTVIQIGNDEIPDGPSPAPQGKTAGASSSVNANQKKVLIATAIVIVGMLLYPPFYETLGGRWPHYVGRGHDWIFDPPSGYFVNVGLLLVQWIGVLIAGGIAYFALKDR